MLAPSGSSTTSPIRPYQTSYHNGSAETSDHAAQPQVSSGSFDRFTTSLKSAAADSSDEYGFQMNLVSRLSQEVRTATTTGDIQALRQQIVDGTYRPNAATTASRILLMGASV